MGRVRRTDLYFKVEIDHDEDEPLERVIQDIQRQIEKVYGVKNVEFSHAIAQPGCDGRYQLGWAAMSQIVVLSADPKTARPGLRGNLILQALVERARQAPAAGQRRLQQVPVGFLPAVPFELVPAT